MYSLDAPWNLYLVFTEMLKPMPQNKTANISQAIRMQVPQYMPIPSLITPIRKGEGKSPNKCMKNIATATAWGLRSSFTLFIIPILAGPTPLNKIYMNKLNSATPIHSKKNEKDPDPKDGAIIAPTKAIAQAIPVTMVISLAAFSVIK